MEMMNRAIEDAAAFTDLKRRLLDGRNEVARAMREQGKADDVPAPAEALGLARQPGENRADHRARLKRERREATKVTHGQR